MNLPPGARPETRGPLRRLLDVWGVALPPLSVPHEQVGFRTRDGVALVGDLLHGPAGPGGGGPAVVLLHGFAAHRRKPAYARLAERLSENTAVLALDLRGHGGSGGRSTLGDREVHDVRAAAAFLRAAGHPWIALVGASMGATAALRAAGQTPHLVHALAAISAPAEFVRDGAPAVALLARMMGSAPLRLVLQAALRIRVARAWGEPVPAVRLIGAIHPTPLLLVHGDDDAWFGSGHVERLTAAAAPATCAVWREPEGFGHAEDGFDDAFADRLAAGLLAVRSTGTWPGRDDLTPGPGRSTPTR